MTRARICIGPTLALLAVLTPNCGSTVITRSDGAALTDGAIAAGAQDALPPAHSYTFVLDHLTVDDDDSPAASHTGFNLDGLFSGANDANGCNHRDLFSAIDPDQNCAVVGANGTCAGGVDNQFPTFVNAFLTSPNMDFRRALADSIDRSALVILVRVLGITDPADLEQPSGVTVNLYFGYPTFGGACTAVTAGQTYSVARSSLLAGATTIDQAVYSFRGSIRDGRLVVATDANSVLHVPAPPIPGARLNLDLHGIQFRAKLSATGLSLGVLGGWVPGGSIIQFVGIGPTDYCLDFQDAIGGLVDIQLNGICDDSSTGRRLFGGISLGLGLTAVPALISTTIPIADYQAPMTCSYTPPVDAGTPWPPDRGGACQ